MTGATKKIGQTLTSYTFNGKTWKRQGPSKRNAYSWFEGEHEARPHFTIWPEGAADDTISIVEATIEISGTAAHLQCHVSNCFLKLDAHLPSSKMGDFLAQMNDMEGALREFLSVSQIMGPKDEAAYMKQLRSLARFMLNNNMKLPGVN